jgi:hypothetical protein
MNVLVAYFARQQRRNDKIIDHGCITNLGNNESVEVHEMKIDQAIYVNHDVHYNLIGQENVIITLIFIHFIIKYCTNAIAIKFMHVICLYE